MKKYCFGADIGGTTVKFGLFDQDGIVLDKWEIPKLVIQILVLVVSFIKNNTYYKSYT